MRVILTSLSKSLQKGKRSAKTAFFLHAGSFLHEMRFLRFFRVCVRGRFCAVKRTDKSKTFATFGKGAGCCVGGRRYGRMIEARGKARETRGAFRRARRAGVFSDADDRSAGRFFFIIGMADAASCPCGSDEMLPFTSRAVEVKSGRCGEILVERGNGGETFAKFETVGRRFRQAGLNGAARMPAVCVCAR